MPKKPSESAVINLPVADDQSSPAIALRSSNELLPNVITVGETITGCSESEVKNFLATADFAQRQLVQQLAEMWHGICKTASKAGKENEKAAKVSVSIKIDIDHSNIQLMDTRVTTSYSEKHVTTGEIQEDLSQTEFALKTA
jgi:hypothetical protein